MGGGAGAGLPAADDGAVLKPGMPKGAKEPLSDTGVPVAERSANRALSEEP